MLTRSLPPGGLLDRPGQRGAQGLVGHRATGLADGHQPLQCPFLRTALPQLDHQETVRQHDEVHVPGLAPRLTQLTVPQPKLLLAVPMEGLRARPTTPVYPHDPRYLPGDSVRHQDLARLRVVLVPPQDHDPHLVLHIGDLDRHREVPLPLVADPQLLAILGRDRRGQFAGLFRLTLPDQLTVEFQIADVTPGTTPVVSLAVD